MTKFTTATGVIEQTTSDRGQVGRPRCEAVYRLPSQCNIVERQCRRKAQKGKKLCPDCLALKEEMKHDVRPSAR